MFNSREDLLGRIFRRRPEALKALVQSEPVQSLLQKAENEVVQRRAALVERLRTAPERHRNAAAEANRKADAARLEVLRAHAALAAANEVPTWLPRLRHCP